MLDRSPTTAAIANTLPRREKLAANSPKILPNSLFPKNLPLNPCGSGFCPILAQSPHRNSLKTGILQKPVKKIVVRTFRFGQGVLLSSSALKKLRLRPSFPQTHRAILSGILRES